MLRACMRLQIGIACKKRNARCVLRVHVIISGNLGWLLDLQEGAATPTTQRPNGTLSST